MSKEISMKIIEGLLGDSDFVNTFIPNIKKENDEKEALLLKINDGVLSLQVYEETTYKLVTKFIDSEGNILSENITDNLLKLEKKVL